MKLFVFFLTIFLSVSSFAITAFDRNGGAGGEPGANRYHVGLQAGQVGLLRDQGNKASGAIGFGVLGGYSITDALLLELSYLQSSKDHFKHKEYAFGVANYFNNYESMFFHWAGGLAFVDNTLDLTSQSLSDTAFSLYAGLGLDVLTKGPVSFGVQGRYYKVFDSSKKDSLGNEYKIADDFYTVLFRVIMTF